MRGLKHRLDALEASMQARGEIEAAVASMAPDDRCKLARLLKAQIHAELIGTRGAASEPRRAKREVTLACIEAAENTVATIENNAIPKRPERKPSGPSQRHPRAAVNSR